MLAAAGVAAGAGLAAPASAQGYPPHRTINIVVGFAPGGAIDLVARVVAQKLSQKLGHSYTGEKMTAGAAAGEEKFGFLNHGDRASRFERRY